MTIHTAAANSFSVMKTRIENCEARIGVIGLGFVGLPLALVYTEAKFRVTGYDYAWIAQHASLVVDTRNATRGIQGDNIVRC